MLANKIAAKAGKGARRLYESNGYDEIAQRPMVKDGWKNDADNWVLLAKSL